RAQQAEAAGLAAAGAVSYIGFTLRQHSASTSLTELRHQRVEAAVDCQEALEHWRALAGDTLAGSAVAARPLVLAASLDSGEPPSVSNGALRPPGRRPSAVAEAYHERIDSLRGTAERVPLVLDEALAGLNAGTRAWMLDVVARAARGHQTVYLTDDAEVASWGRVRALGGEPVEVVELATAARPARADR
ncbi:MAG: hypothetical protein ACRD0F_08085, partial [Acidimicrobiales bacterium]